MVQPVERGALQSAEALYRENYAFVWRNARRLGASDDWVDDAVHEVFLVATRRLPEFEGRSSITTWLFAITFRVVQRLRRDRARQRQHTARFVREAAAPIANAADESEAAQYLRYLLGMLPEAQRLVLILAELEGFTSAAVAESLGVPAGTVDSRLRAARAQLARLIERERVRDERLSK
jgi:RNA polymerase sigma-70 factor, ECF subfamily